MILKILREGEIYGSIKREFLPRIHHELRGDRTGHEQAGVRPALVLSSVKYNGPTGLAIVCPITSQEKGYPFEVPIPSGYKVTGVILADQVKNADWEVRKVKFLCTLPESIVEDVLATFGTIFEE